MAEYLPPPVMWVPMVGTVCLFILVAVLASRKGSNSPASVAFGISAGALVAGCVLFAALSPGGSNANQPPSAWGALGVFVPGALVFVGPLAGVFSALHRRSVAMRTTAVVLTGLVSFPIGLLVSVFAACIADGGACI